MLGVDPWTRVVQALLELRPLTRDDFAPRMGSGRRPAVPGPARREAHSDTPHWQASGIEFNRPIEPMRPWRAPSAGAGDAD